MKMFIGALVLMATMTACTMPTTTVKSAFARSSISIAGAPANSILFVDGLRIGKVEDYNGEPNVLAIEPGTHHIVVQQGNSAIYDQQIFVDNDLLTRVVVR